MGETISTKCLYGNLQDKGHLQTQAEFFGRIILRAHLEMQAARMGSGGICLGIVYIGGAEPSGSPARVNYYNGYIITN
jgi:hypothetical protein